MAFRCAYLPTWETQLLSSPDDGSCRRTKFAVTNALWTTRKTKPVFDPLKLPTVQRSGDLGTALLDRLERIYKEGMPGNNDVLLPMEPLWAGPLFQGKPMRVAYQGVVARIAKRRRFEPSRDATPSPAKGEWTPPSRRWSPTTLTGQLCRWRTRWTE